METNAHRALRISLAASAVLFLAIQSFAAQTHIVRRGDTLSLLARKYHTTTAVLQKANGIKNINIIRVGQVLTIPSAPSNTPAPPADPTTYGRVTVDKLEVKAGDKTIATLSKDASFVVVSREGDSFNIKLADGRTGSVEASGVALEETRKPLPVSDTWSVKSDIVRTALAYRGARYRRGGVGNGGFDCSGFVKAMYAKKGINLPHDTRALYKCGKPVAKTDLQPGDLLFFVNTYRRGISHVGLYIGDGKFIHASTSRGGVRVDELKAAYYQRHYYGAKRI